MLAKKKKLGKKNYKEDKLVTYYSKSLEYFEIYRNQIIIGAAVLVVIIAAIIYFGNQARELEIEASAELAKISHLYESRNYEAVINGIPQNNTPSFAEIADKYSGTEAGEIARINLAHAYFYTGQYDEAVEQYKKYSGDIEIYEASALAGIAACYEAKGDAGEAADYYEDAAFVYENNPQNSEYLLNAAINYIKSDSPSRAEDLLKTLKEKYETSSQALEADKYLAMVQLQSNS